MLAWCAAAATEASSGLSTGAIVGIAVGCGVAGLAILFMFLWYMCLRNRCYTGRNKDVHAEANKKTMTPMQALPFWLKGKNAEQVRALGWACTVNPIPRTLDPAPCSPLSGSAHCPASNKSPSLLLGLNCCCSNAFAPSDPSLCWLAMLACCRWCVPITVVSALLCQSCAACRFREPEEEEEGEGQGTCVQLILKSPWLEFTT